MSRRSVRPVRDEAARSLPGDELVANAKFRWNHAVTIGARPDEVWPWLVQMGCRRAGWYSYDGLDNGGVPSAERSVPELQHVEVGDILPMSPTADDQFVVPMVEPQRALVLGDAAGGMSWAFVLESVDQDRTRLITRIRATYDRPAAAMFLEAGCTRRTSRCNANNCSTSNDSWRRQHEDFPTTNLRGWATDASCGTWRNPRADGGLLVSGPALVQPLGDDT